jgi:hypothetical protein
MRYGENGCKRVRTVAEMVRVVNGKRNAGETPDGRFLRFVV